MVPANYLLLKSISITFLIYQSQNFPFMSHQATWLHNALTERVALHTDDRATRSSSAKRAHQRGVQPNLSKRKIDWKRYTGGVERRKQSLKSLFQPVKMNKITKIPLMPGSVLGERLTKNEMVLCGLKGKNIHQSNLPQYNPSSVLVLRK